MAFVNKPSSVKNLTMKLLRLFQKTYEHGMLLLLMSFSRSGAKYIRRPGTYFFVCHLRIQTDILFSLAAKVDPVAHMKNHVAGAVKDKLLKELEGHTGETDYEDSEDETEAKK